VSKSWLECPECGDDAIESDDDGLFQEDQEATCQMCGTICRVSVDCGLDCDTEGADGVASAVSNDEVEDIGQPRCDCSCGAVEEFRGKPCLWTCKRCEEWKANVARAALSATAKEVKQ
jgi:hypothetical protein